MFIKKNSIQFLIATMVIGISLVSCSNDDLDKYMKRRKHHNGHSIDSTGIDSSYKDSTRREGSDTSSTDSSRSIPDVVVVSVTLDQVYKHEAEQVKYVYSYTDTSTGVRYYKRITTTVPWHGYDKQPKGPDFDSSQARIVEDSGFWYGSGFPIVWKKK